MFLIGSPMCTHFCSWQALNNAKHSRDPEVVKRERLKALVHFDFMCEMYHEQLNEGHYFLHEHPAGATSWGEECVKDVAQRDGVEVVIGDRCLFGQVDTDGHPIKKPTKWMSNSAEVLKILGARCRGRMGACSKQYGGSHVVAEGSRTKGTAIYPFALCKAILKGFRNQLVADGRLTLGVVGIQRPEETMADKDLERMCSAAMGQVIEINAVHGEEEFYDSITGQRLRADLVRAARREEMEYFAAKRVCTNVSRKDTMLDHGKPSISVKWIDVNKGDGDKPNYRSRLAAREVGKAWEATVFAPIPS